MIVHFNLIPSLESEVLSGLLRFPLEIVVGLPSVHEHKRTAVWVNVPLELLLLGYIKIAQSYVHALIKFPDIELYPKRFGRLKLRV